MLDCKVLLVEQSESLFLRLFVFQIVAFQRIIKDIRGNFFVHTRDLRIHFDDRLATQFDLGRATVSDRTSNTVENKSPIGSRFHFESNGNPLAIPIDRLGGRRQDRPLIVQLTDQLANIQLHIRIVLEISQNAFKRAWVIQEGVVKEADVLQRTGKVPFADKKGRQIAGHPVSGSHCLV